ncbi:MAG: IS256 family transposase [Nitrospirae bacterium]|nr:IS256 family transposase [Nitrospirota bacterium]
MGKDNTVNKSKTTVFYEGIEELVRMKIQGYIQDLLNEEIEEFLGRNRYERKEELVDGNSGYYNGYGKPRRVSMKTGTIEVRRPRLRNLEERFESRILPLFKRRTKEVGELLPELYLQGLAGGDFELALRGLLGEGAPLSSGSIQRLKAKWEAEYDTWRKTDLNEVELIYMWADGLYVKAGIEKDKAALLVIIGAGRDGKKRLLAVESGYRESKESWGNVLRSLRERGLKAPRLTIADGNLGLWGALAQVYPESKEQRCWNHKIVNVLGRLPKRVQSQAREYLCKMPYSETRADCERLKAHFNTLFGKAYPKAMEILENDWDRMVTFYEFPKEHWGHLRTTNIIESPFASVRLRTNAAKRYKKVSNAVALIWKVLLIAEKRFRKLNAPNLMAEVYEGVKYVNGIRYTENKEAA